MRIIREIAYWVLLVGLGIGTQQFWTGFVMTRIDYASHHQQSLELVGKALMVIVILAIGSCTRRNRKNRPDQDASNN